MRAKGEDAISGEQATTHPQHFVRDLLLPVPVFARLLRVPRVEVSHARDPLLHPGERPEHVLDSLLPRLHPRVEPVVTRHLLQLVLVPAPRHTARSRGAKRNAYQVGVPSNSLRVLRLVEQRLLPHVVVGVYRADGVRRVCGVVLRRVAVLRILFLAPARRLL